METKRTVVPALEEMLYETIPVLDHGFIRIIDYMGDDSSIVQAARVSYGKGTKQVTQDQALINHLWRNQHASPFEMCEIKFHIKLPIFIARQWIRHRTANVNEYSARYSILDREFYIPSPEHLAEQSESNKQGRENVLDAESSHKILEFLKKSSLEAYDGYEDLLNGNPGIARELARMNLTLNYYTQWYWKIDLRNLLHFVRLRADHHAQYEIRVYAEIILDILRKWVPFTYDAFMNYDMGSFRLSKTAVQVVKAWLRGENITQEESGLSKREWGELTKALNKNS